LQEIVLKDLLIDDAGVVVHNYNVFGEIAELYRIPGWQVIPLSYPDLTVPQGNDAAYVWDDCGKVKGWFSNRELTYIMESPQGDGYGMSPVEALVYVTTATLLGDNVFIRNLKEGFIPPGILNLKDASDSERDRFESVLNAKLNRTQGNRFIVVSGVPSEDGEFQYTPIPQGVDFQKAQILEYLKMAPAVKAFVFGFQAADIGILMDGANGKASDSEVRAALVHRRGISSRLDLLEAYYNAEIIKQEFPFKNVRFKYVREIPVSDPLRIEQAYSVAINNGSMTRNEARKLRGQRPVPGGDVPTITTGNSQFQVDALEPASQDDDQCGEEGTDKTEGGVDPVFQARPKKRNDATERATMQGTRTTD
jgi:hypothetical protein